MKPKILIICGPTASGKTSLGIKCANQFNGEIISADSMQIYKKLDIGTAKPTQSERKQANHHLIDIVEPYDEFSVGEYTKLSKEKINELVSRNKLPIFVGGTGLYIRSLLNAYTFASAPKNLEIREKYNKLLEEKGKEYIHNCLKEKDLEASQRIHMNDSKRVIRALEIIESSSKTKTEQADIVEELEYDPIIIALDMPRETLYERINKRVDIMFELGVEEEIKALLDANIISKDVQSMQAIGYKEFFPYFAGEVSKEETIELIKKNTRNYAKRQLTFFRSFKNAFWFNPLEQEDEILEFIGERLKYENK